MATKPGRGDSHAMGAYPNGSEEWLGKPERYKNWLEYKEKYSSDWGPRMEEAMRYQSIIDATCLTN